MLALIGASGSGKSTLLRHLAGLACGDRHDTSSIRILGKQMQAGGRLNRQVRNVRSDIGYIFQQFNLVRSEEHTSELQSLMRISYAVFCLQKKIKNTNTINSTVNQTHTDKLRT